MRIARALVVPFALPLALVVLSACGGGGGNGDGGTDYSPTEPSGGTTATPSSSSDIRVSDNAFSPASTTVAPGTTVTWTWAGSADHDVTFSDGPRSPIQSKGSYERTFPTAGSYAYRCSIHGAAMSGTVTVR